MAEDAGGPIPGGEVGEDTLPSDTIPADGADQRALNDQPANPPPALTIHIRSWATPVVGIVMLGVGMLVGYVLRPILGPPAAQAPTSEASASAVTGEPLTEDQIARQESLMDAVLPRVRHFRGDEGATVTLIEFSDFQ